MFDCLTVFSQSLINASFCSVLSTSNVDIVNVYIYIFFLPTNISVRETETSV